MNQSSLFDLTGQTAVIIGGTGVLGGAMAEALAAAGASVVVAGRNAAKGQQRAHAICERGGRSLFVSCDAMDETSLKTLLAETRAWSEVPHILVNAAGGNDPRVTLTPGKTLAEIDTEAWREVFDLNLVGGVLLPCRVLGSAMLEANRGSIINIASVSAHIPLSRVLAYSASKAAVLNLSQFLAREWAPFHVRVNTITPGFFPAEQNRSLLFHPDGTPTPRAEAILTHTPMKRFGESNDLAGALIFLASSAASGFVTGTDIRVDGGFLSQTI